MSTYQSPDWSEVEINWTAGLPENRLFEDHELPLNKDKRYAMSISPASLRDSSGKIIPLRAQTTTGLPTSPRLRGE
jgi:hypothetical protein